MSNSPAGPGAETGSARAIVAAGTVLWRPGIDGPEVAVVHRPRYDDWSLPKGKRDPGEHILGCAIRETLEETGHAVSLGSPLPSVHYSVGPAPKLVHYWLAHADANAPDWPGTAEIDELEFLPIAAAMAKVTHAHDAHTIATAASALDGGPTKPLIILRHGKALPRAQWAGPDERRPLEYRGHDQAGRLTLLLSAYGPARIISSPAERCVATVRPFSTAARSPMLLDPCLTEEAFEDDPDACARAVRQVLDTATSASTATSPASTIMCAHRPLLPTMFDAAEVPAPRQPLRPGEFVVLHHRHGVVSAIERHRA